MELQTARDAFWEWSDEARLQERCGRSDVVGEAIDLSLWDLADKTDTPRGSYTVHILFLLVFLWLGGIWKAQMDIKRLLSYIMIHFPIMFSSTARNLSLEKYDGGYIFLYCQA